MKNLKQTIKSIKNSLDNWDYEKAIVNSNDETTTRAFLIHPFFDLLNYDQIDDYTHEYVADLGSKRGKKVDIAITLGQKSPQILVECKSSSTKLNDNHYNQLRNYMLNTPMAKIGVLSNGLEYKFYVRDNSGALYNTPFFTFDLSEYNTSDLEMLSLFLRNGIDISEILSQAEEIHFLEKFDDALYDVITNPNDELIKLIYQSMGGKRTTESISNKIKELINGVSLKTLSDRVIKNEIASSNSGIITTAEELQSYNIIKTMIGLARSKAIDIERVGYRDYKGFFNILIDDNQRKCICTLHLNGTKKHIQIGQERHEIESVSVAALTKFKKEIVDSATSLFEE